MCMALTQRLKQALAVLIQNNLKVFATIIARILIKVRAWQVRSEDLVHSIIYGKDWIMTDTRPGMIDPCDDQPIALAQSDALDLNQYCVKNPAATFFMRVSGDSMERVGIYSGDILVVDKAVEARCGDVVIAAVDGEFTVKRLQLQPYVSLKPENTSYTELKLSGESELELFGVVVHSIHKMR